MKVFDLRAPQIGLALLAFSTQLQSQVIPDEPCGTCAVKLVRVLSIPDHADDVTISGTPTIGVSGGAHVMAFSYDGALAVWHEGSMRSLGRKGHGPNEFPPNSIVQGMATNAAGQLFMVSGNRFTVLSESAREIVRQARLTWRSVGFAILGDRAVVGISADRLAFVNDSGVVDAEIDLPRTGVQRELLRLAASGDTALWIGSVTNYHIDLVARNGSVIRSIVRTPEWMKGASANLGSSKVSDIRELADGKLLVVLRVPDPRFDPAAYRIPRPIEQLRGRPIYDTIIEIIDPATNQLLVTARYDQVLHLVHGSSDLFATREGVDGSLYFDVYSVRLSREGRTP